MEYTSPSSYLMHNGSLAIPMDSNYRYDPRLRILRKRAKWMKFFTHESMNEFVMVKYMKECYITDISSICKLFPSPDRPKLEINGTGTIRTLGKPLMTWFRRLWKTGKAREMKPKFSSN
jgi:hypothetical protein